jgi:hypothetical protein
MSGKTRNEDLSIFFFLKSLLTGKVTNIIDSYPYTEIINDKLVIPTVSIEHRQTEDMDGVGEMGASWFRRSWAIDIFAETDTKRDDIAELIYNALDLSFPIRDYSIGYRKDTGLSLLGTDLRIIEYIQPQDRVMRPIYTFNEFNKLKYWRTTISFSTVSTQVV